MGGSAGGVGGSCGGSETGSSETGGGRQKKKTKVGGADGKGAGDGGAADYKQDGEGEEPDEEERVPCEYPGCTKMFKICGTMQDTIACHMKYHHHEDNGGVVLVQIFVCSCVQLCVVCVLLVCGVWCGADVLCVCADEDELQQDDENDDDPPGLRRRRRQQRSRCAVAQLHV
jgi:hypothetical protein